jgi:hypothetical protein
MNAPENFQPFETSDLNLASYLRCREFPILDIRRDHGKSTFLFGDTAVLRSAILEYANDGPVPVRSFCSTMRDLKSIVR